MTIGHPFGDAEHVFPLPDPQLRGILLKLRGSGLAPYHVAGVQESRSRVLRSRELADPGPEVHDVEDFFIPATKEPVRARRYTAAASDAPGLVVYFHGGGWVVGGIEESDAMCRSLANASGCDVISVDYRLAPENIFPAAVDDADAAVAWASQQRPDGCSLVVMGDSAGGNLATVAARRARDRGDDAIVLQVLIYPVTDHRMNTSSYDEHGEQFLISAEDMRWFWDQYVPDMGARQSVEASPGLATDLAGMPPAHFVIARYDPLQDEAAAYASSLMDAGVAVTVDHYDAMVHGFFLLLGQVDTADQALQSVASAIRAAVDGRAVTAPRGVVV